MTTPSGVFLTQPASPSPVASRTTNGRKPTPCTRPSKHIRIAAKPAGAAGHPADSGLSIPPPSTIFRSSPMEPEATARKMVAEARHSPIPETTTMVRRFSTLCLCFCAFLQAARAHAEIQVGAASRVITPEPLLPISGGMGVPKPASEKRGELTARTIVLRKADVSVAIVSLDLLGFPSVLGDRVRAKVNRIPSANILIGSTHTHSAPECYAFPDGKGGHAGDLKYLDFVCDQTALAINEAIDRLQPAWIKIATGEAQGKIAYNYYAPDLYDRRMNVIQAKSPQGKTIATLVNYAVHPEVLGNAIGICSPDLVGSCNQGSCLTSIPAQS